MSDERKIKRISAILRLTSNLFYADRFEDVDNMLTDAEEETDITMRLGWLAATLPAKSKLKNRGRYFDNTAELLKADPRRDKLLQGLK